MTDNILEIEARALAHQACKTTDSRILLTDFACAYPSVNHSWIFDVLEKAELPAFIRLFFSQYLQRKCERCRVCKKNKKDNSLRPEV